MGDHSLGGFWSACVIEGISHFFVNGPCRGIVVVIFGLIAYYAYVGLKKSGDRNRLWTGMDVMTGFFAASLALWVPVFLDIIL